jgi:hypothetical protein
MKRRGMEEILERIGKLIDEVDNLLAATELPVSPQIHLNGLINGLTELQKELREIYLAAGGEDVWSE